MAFNADLKQLLKPYYWVNILLSLSYVTAKRTGYICNYLFPESDCELDSRETEILFFLIIVVMLRTKKAGSVTMVNYLSSSFVYTKIANLILWMYADVRYGVPFAAIIILCSLLLPEPTYMGPENIVYFRGFQGLNEELKYHKRTTWIVCLYAAWHPACVNFAPVFAELSHKYTLLNLRFGKIDIGRHSDAAAKFRIQDGPTSRQLPTVLLFSEGVEKMRRPHADHTGKLKKFLFSIDNMKAAFDLDGIYQECMERLDATKAKRAEKAEKSVKAEKDEKTEKAVKVENIENAEKVEKAEQVENTEKEEKVENTEKAEKVENAEKVEKAEKTEMAEKVENTEKAEKIENTDKAERVENAEKVEKVENTKKAVRVENAEKAEKVGNAEKVDKAEKTEKVETSEKVENAEKVDKAEKTEKAEMVENGEKAEKVENAEKADRAEKTEVETAENGEKMDKVDEIEKAEKTEDVEKAEKTKKTD